jgi:transcriptional regulator with XRE-family HTH domain
MTIGEAVRMRILELCKENLITVNGLALKCGITQSTLSNLVLGKNKNPQINTIKKICDGLEITIQDFFNSPIFDDLEQEIK